MRTPPAQLAPRPLASPAGLPVLPLLPATPVRPRPLPDAVAIRQVELPASAPPYDDEIAPPGPAPLAPPLPPGTLRASTGPASTGPADGDPVATDPPATSPAGPGQGAGPVPGPRTRSPAGGVGEDGEWPSRFAQVLAETLAGARPDRQVRPWTTEQARRRIRHLGPLLQAGPRPVVRRVLTSAPARDVRELAIVVSVGPRTRALAVRLERRQDPPRTGAAARGAPAGRGRQASGGLTALAAVRAVTSPPGQPGTWVCTAIEAA